MEKIICLLLLMFAVAGCEDDYYMEGRVTTYNATEITKKSATLHGKVKITTAGNEIEPHITARGFVLGISSGMLYQKIFAAGAGEGDFSAAAINLQPNTTYYIKAFVNIHNATHNNQDESDVFYGNLVEFTTAE